MLKLNQLIFNALTFSLCLCADAIHAQPDEVIELGADHIQDAWVWSWPNASSINFGEPNNDNGNLNNVIRSEVWQWTQGEFDTIRGLINFDLSVIPEGIIISEATLELSFFANPNFTENVGENDLQIHLITSEWDEGAVTWDNAPTYNPESILAIGPSSSPTENYSLDLTDVVVAMHSNPNMYFGILLKMAVEDDYKGLTFASSEHDDSTLRPRMVIEYTTDILGINNSTSDQMKVYPNPTADNVKLIFDQLYPDLEVLIYQSEKLIDRLSLHDKFEHILELPDSTGLYTIIVNSESKRIAACRIVKE